MQTIEVSHHIPTKDPHTLPDIGMIALEWMDMTLISLIWGGGVQVGGEGVVVVGRWYFYCTLELY